MMKTFLIRMSTLECEVTGGKGLHRRRRWVLMYVGLHRSFHLPAGIYFVIVIYK
jgi:hypothetical protein